MPDYMTRMYSKVPSLSQITSSGDSIQLNIPDPAMNCSERSIFIPDQPIEIKTQIFVLEISD